MEGLAVNIMYIVLIIFSIMTLDFIRFTSKVLDTPAAEKVIRTHIYVHEVGSIICLLVLFFTDREGLLMNILWGGEQNHSLPSKLYELSSSVYLAILLTFFLITLISIVYACRRKKGSDSSEGELIIIERLLYTSWIISAIFSLQIWFVMKDMISCILLVMVLLQLVVKMLRMRGSRTAVMTIEDGTFRSIRFNI